jgi:hypothetical protein
MARIPRITRWALAGFVALALLPARAADHAPQPAPPLFVTQDYGLIAHIPPGLTYCPLPTDWSGSNHGTQVYLVPPDQCGEARAYASSTRNPTSFVPTTSIFYGWNVADIRRTDRDDSPPETNTELAEQMCGDVYAPLPPGIVLLGTPAAGCRADQDGVATIQAMVLYAHPDSPANKPDAMLIVSLETTPDRLSADLVIFTRIAAGVRVCRPSWSKPNPSREPCPEGATWW